MSTFKTTATYRGVASGEGQVKAPGLESRFSVPVNLGGVGIGTNPEELLLSAAGSCFLITLSYLLQRESVAYESVSVETTAEAVYERGLSLKTLTHAPAIHFGKHSPISASKQSELFHAAERACMVSNAMKGNVEMHIKSHHEV